MKLVTYNIQYGLGKDDRYDLARIAGEVDGADVIALQEVERFWQRSGMVDQPAVLASVLPDYYWVYGPSLDMACDLIDAEGRPTQRRRQFGNMLLARVPIVSSRVFPLPKYGTLTQHSIQQSVLEGVIEHNGRALRVCSVHLSHLDGATRLPQVEALLDIHRRAATEGGAWCGGHPDPDAGWTEGEIPPMPREAVLMGDFNHDWKAQEYDRIVGPLSSKHGRLNNIDGFVDAWVAAGNAEDAGNTLHNSDRRIDYCFVSASLASQVVGCRIDDEATGSDHRPVWTEIDL